MLAAQGIISEADRDELLARARAGARRELARRDVPVRRRRRGHPHGDRAPADRDRRARSAASCTRPARATTRSPPTWRCSSAPTPTRRSERIDAAGRDAARAGRSATSTGRCPATRTCSAPSRSTSATTCSRTSWMLVRDRERFAAVSAATAELPLGAGRARRASTSTPTAARSPRELGFAARGRELDRRRLQPRLRARLPGRRRHLRHPPVAARGPRSCCGRARSSASARCPTRGPRARRSCPRRRTPTPPSCCAPRRRGVVGQPGGAARRACTGCR